MERSDRHRRDQRLGADDLQGSTSSEIVADLVAGACVVKAGHNSAPTCSGSDPRWPGPGVTFLSGDDADARATVASLFKDAGFAPIDLGGLATGGAMQQYTTRSPVST